LHLATGHADGFQSAHLLLEVGQRLAGVVVARDRDDRHAAPIAAEQPSDIDAEPPPHRIPQRTVHAGNGFHHKLVVPVRIGDPEHALPMPLDGERVLADQEGRQFLVDNPDDLAPVVPVVAVVDASYDTFVGGDPRDDGAPRVYVVTASRECPGQRDRDRDRVDRGDAHGGSILAGDSRKGVWGRLLQIEHLCSRCVRSRIRVSVAPSITLSLVPSPVTKLLMPDQSIRPLRPCSPVLALLLFLSCLIWSVPAAVAQAEPSQQGSLSVTELEALVETLDDPERREELVSNLRTLIDANRAIEPDAAAGETNLLGRLSAQIDRAGGQLVSAVQFAVNLPDLWQWIEAQVSDPAARTRWLEVLGKLAAVIAAGLLAEWLIRRALKGPREAIERRGSERLLV